MTNDPIRFRELEVAEKRAQADILTAAAHQALAEVVRESAARNATEHDRIVDKLDDTGLSVRALTVEIRTTTDIARQALGILFSRPYLSGVITGIVAAFIALGPVALTALPSLVGLAE